VSFRTLVVTVAAATAAGCGGPATEAVETHSIVDPWQPIPFAVDEAILRSADAACRDLQLRVAAVGEVLQPVVADTRGDSKVLVVYVGGNTEADCLVPIAADGTADPASGGSSSGNTFEPLPPGAVAITTGTSSSDGSSVVGRVGPGVARVEIGTASGRRLQASLTRTGWFAAWWPGEDAHGPVTAFDASGTVTGTT
jgi:hypothetical protein